MKAKSQYMLPMHGDIFYTVHYEIPNIRPNGWWPVSREEMNDPGLQSILDINEKICLGSWPYLFARREAFLQVRSLFNKRGLTSVKILRHQYFSAGKPGPDGKILELGQCFHQKTVIIPLTIERSHPWPN